MESKDFAEKSTGPSGGYAKLDQQQPLLQQEAREVHLPGKKTGAEIEKV